MQWFFIDSDKVPSESGDNERGDNPMCLSTKMLNALSISALRDLVLLFYAPQSWQKFPKFWAPYGVSLKRASIFGLRLHYRIPIWPQKQVKIAIFWFKCHQHDRQPSRWLLLETKMKPSRFSSHRPHSSYPNRRTSEAKPLSVERLHQLHLPFVLRVPHIERFSFVSNSYTILGDFFKQFQVVPSALSMPAPMRVRIT